MSAHGDVKKALKDNGYKLVGTGKHLVFADAKGHEVRLHLGSQMRQCKVRTALKDIERGNIRTGKKTTKPVVELKAEWFKVTPRNYVYARGQQELGQCVQNPDRTWSTCIGLHQPDGYEFCDLMAAKLHVEFVAKGEK